jgi:hypothetical protein
MKQVFFIDNEPIGFVSWVYGGFYRSSAQSISRGYIQDKHLAGTEMTPLVIGIGLELGKPIFDWIENALEAGVRVEKDCGIAVVDPNTMMIKSRWNFLSSYISEMMIPACNRSSTEPGYLTITIMPNRVEYLPDVGSTISNNPMRKPWSISNFRVEIGTLPSNKVVRINSFSWKVEYVEDRNSPSGYQTSITLPDLKLTMGGNFGDIDPWMAWYHQWLEQGSGEKYPGSLQFLDGSRNQLARINFQNMGPLYFGMESTEADAANINLFQVGLFCNAATLTGY